MKSNTKQVRDAVKNLIIEKGANNILNRTSQRWLKESAVHTATCRTQ